MYTFLVNGTYEVNMTAMDLAGNSAWDVVVVNVLLVDDVAPVADAGVNQSVDQGTAVTFNGVGTTDNVGIVNYTWTFVYEEVNVTLYNVVESRLFSPQ